MNGTFLGYAPYEFQVLHAIRQKVIFSFLKKWEDIYTKQRKINSQEGDEHDMNF